MTEEEKQGALESAASLVVIAVLATVLAIGLLVHVAGDVMLFWAGR